MQIGIKKGPAYHDLIKHIPSIVPSECAYGAIRLSGQKRQVYDGVKCITGLKSFCDGRIFWIIVEVAQNNKIGRDCWIVL